MHLAFFGAGAVAGAVITSTVAKKNHATAVIPEAPPKVIVPTATTPVTLSTQKSDVLKFGSPGQFFRAVVDYVQSLSGRT